MPRPQRSTLALDGVAKPIPMEKDATGVWTVTTQPLAPEIYGYHFEADGDRRLDPANPHFTINLVNVSNLITVPGDTPQPGRTPTSPTARCTTTSTPPPRFSAFPNNQSDYFVYTPPGYDQKAKKPYPVLYLLHGWSDSDAGWTAVGRAEPHPRQPPRPGQDQAHGRRHASRLRRPVLRPRTTTSGTIPPRSTTTPTSSPRPCSPKCCRESSPPTTSPKTATTAPSPASPWAASKVFRSASPTPTSSPGSAASAPPSSNARLHPEAGIARPQNRQPPPPLDRLRHRRLSHRAQSQTSRLPQNQRHAGHADRDPRPAHLAWSGATTSFTSPRCSSNRNNHSRIGADLRERRRLRLTYSPAAAPISFR